MSLVGTLAGLAGNIGAPLVKTILEDKIGAGNAALAETVIKTIAGNASVPVERLSEVAKSNPQIIERAIKATEQMAPELVALYEKGIAHQLSVMEMEQREPWWAWAWRPGMMWLFAILWLWNIVFLHVFNAVFKIALPQTDLVLLFQLNGLYMALYMGGHTIKDGIGKAVAAWQAKK